MRRASPNQIYDHETRRFFFFEKKKRNKNAINTHNWGFGNMLNEPAGVQKKKDYKVYYNYSNCDG